MSFFSLFFHLQRDKHTDVPHMRNATSMSQISKLSTKLKHKFIIVVLFILKVPQISHFLQKT